MYLRQSSPGQVRDHIGSAAAQRMQEQLAEDYGFREIRVVDGDQGRSGASIGIRSGFDEVCRLVAGDLVGAVFAVTASRLSREMRVFSDLIVLCRHHDTVLVLDGRPRDPSNPQDVGMLHVEGTFAEMDNGLRMQGLRDARRAKARLGKRVTRIPTGWIVGADGAVIFDPETYDAIKELPNLFWTHGSAYAAVAAMRKAGKNLPVRRRGRLDWNVPTVERFMDFLRRPASSGTYVFGRTESATTLPRLPNGHHARKRVAEDQWIKIENYYPAYLTTEEQAEISSQVSRNGFRSKRRPGRGAAFCQGMLTCALCGGTLTVADPRPRTFSHRYQCTAQSARFGSRSCQSLQGRDIDAAVERIVLEAVSAPPVSLLTAALEEARAVERAHASHVEAERVRLLREQESLVDQLTSIDPRNSGVHSLMQRKLEEAIAARAEFERRVASEPMRAPVDGNEGELNELCRIVADLPDL